MRYHIQLSSCSNESSDYFTEGIDFLVNNLPSNVDVGIDKEGEYAPEVLFILVDKKCDLVGRKPEDLNQAEELGIPVYILYKRGIDDTWNIYNHSTNNSNTKSEFGMNVTENVLGELTFNATKKSSVVSPPPPIPVPVMQDIVIENITSLGEGIVITDADRLYGNHTKLYKTDGYKVKHHKLQLEQTNDEIKDEDFLLL